MLPNWPAAKQVVPRPPRAPRASGRTVKVIGAFKLVKGLLLLAAAFGLLKIFQRDPQETMRSFIQQISVDPGSKYFQMVATKFLHLSERLPLVMAGTIVYGLLFSVEGIGLLLQKRWAEWLTVIVTGSFLPLEIYEMAHRATPVRGVVIALNLAILVYLIVRLKRR
jgi:uncharacterized membrane protein (DUF2068 family)